MLAHTFNRFCVVTKFILPTINDLKFSTNNINETCNYLQQEKGSSVEAKKYVSDLVVYCRKIVTFIHDYRKQFFSFNYTVHNRSHSMSLPQCMIF